MKKKLLGYVGFILFMSCFIFVGKASVDGAQEYMNNTFRMPIIWVIVNSIAPYIGFGFLLGLNPFLKENPKEGKWRINLIKLIVIGGPSLIFSYGFHLIFFLNIHLGHFGSFLVTKPSTYMILFRVLLGYVVATSFYKENSIDSI